MNRMQHLQPDFVLCDAAERIKTDYEVMEKREVPESGNVRKDEVIVSFKLAAEGKAFLRRIEVWVEEKHRSSSPNNLKLAASTIASIYKDRWQIELFFKALKVMEPSTIRPRMATACADFGRRANMASFSFSSDVTFSSPT
jgi:IS4 transposase